ncbi:circularly permuted type 2 ATP-grasp protein [Agaribacterium haliotis]|uniref:circularly permuted type 2 ATP-grasp protein n=1 Tax=Agaribacterium haliotis TaxID=2013869 RepID=UPI001EFD625D|nr:circularly permuted type 2 ATP-grasp protein [Agaribacterium haliotis]
MISAKPTDTAPLEVMNYVASRPGACDEVFDEAGNVKAHWAQLLSSLKGMGFDAFADRQKKALRILRDDGATYNIYDQGDAGSRTWGLDLVPALISSEEWASTEAGLLERAELFNLLLKDIYGERKLLRSGVLPPEVLFAHRGFLRACQGLDLPGEHNLVLHAVDMMRDSSGQLRVLTDRSQCPSGLGYALENRTVMSRVLPSLFRNSRVHRLAPFFQRLRVKLNSLSPSDDQARVVVLTPGAHNETYFEHAYLANYLGLDLVQSGDLVVRNGFVWMKSLAGLSRVDVILRRVDDWYCDPVELRSDSQLGVANLLEVVRAGRVAIANPLGSGILESPVLLKFLPAIAKALLGRDLRLGSVQNYWYADAEDRAYIDAHLDELVIKPVFRRPGERSVCARELSEQQRLALKQRLAAAPLDYVAQPLIEAAPMPSFDGRALQPRPVIVRSFAVACDNSYALMPGALTRVGVDESSFHISNQAGSLSKDTWVIASEPQLNLRDDEQPEPQANQSELNSLPSRVVENLFWMGRYAERAEASLRILRTVFVLLNGEEDLPDTVRRILLGAVTKISSTQPGFLEASDEELADPEARLLGVITDANLVGSVRSNLNAMLFCSDESKELLSSDTLRVINDIRDALGELDASFKPGLNSAPEEALDPLVTALMALSGLVQESMVRNIGWHFLQLGRRLERGMQTATIISEFLSPELAPAEQNILIEAMLLSMETLISYRRRYRARLAVQSSLDLVLLDTSNPRSLLFQIEAIDEHLKRLPTNQEPRHELQPEQRAILEAQSSLKLSVLTELSQRDGGERKKLSDKLAQVGELLALISTQISDKHFDHRESSRQLVRSNWEF